METVFTYKIAIFIKRRDCGAYLSGIGERGPRYTDPQTSAKEAEPPPLRIFAVSHPGHCPEHVPVVRLACICVLLENTNASLMRNLSRMSKFLVLRGMSLCLTVFKVTACNGRKKFKSTRVMNCTQVLTAIELMTSGQKNGEICLSKVCALRICGFIRIPSVRSLCRYRCG